MKNLFSLLLLITSTLFSNVTFAQIDSTHFVTTWKTNNPGGSGDSSITINTDNGPTYNFDVDWNNDGVFDDLNVTGDIVHNYGDTGIYTVRIRGQFPRILFGVYSPDPNKIISIDQWGSTAWTTMYRAFERCNNLGYTATDIPNFSIATSLDNMFLSANIFNGDIGNWDVSNITDMNGIFGRCYAFNQDISSWDVSNVVDFSSMFYSCRAFNQNIGGWDVSSASDLSGMFRGEHIIPNVFNQDISSWDVDSVSDFSDMFMYCDSFNINIGGWDVSSATDMTYMFRSAISFNQDISSWDVDSVIDMQGTFQRASSFNQDISSWDVSGTTNMWWMFNDADSFNQDISNWQVSAVNNMYGMFNDADAFNQNLANWNIQSVTTMRHLFARSGMTTANYDNTLIAWEAKPHQMNVEFYPYQMTYCLADSARARLITDGWVFANGDSKNCAVGINESFASEAAFNVFPNPTSGNLVFETLVHSNDNLIEVYNGIGEKVKTVKLTTLSSNIDLNNLDDGLYIIKYGQVMKKVILNK